MKHPQTNEEFDKKWNPIYNKRVKDSHDMPSPETRERLVFLETNQKNLMDKLEENQILNEKSHEHILQSMKEFHDSTNYAIEQITKKLDVALEKKADKWVQVLIVWLGYTIGTGLLAVLGGLIIKSIIHFN